MSSCGIQIVCIKRRLQTSGQLLLLSPWILQMEPLTFSPEDPSAFKPKAAQSFVLTETGDRFTGTAVTEGVVGKRLAFSSDGIVLFFPSGVEFDAVSRSVQPYWIK